jgi:hypothetical protein
MVVVIHPNIVNPDEGERLHIGTAVIVTNGGSESVHDFSVEPIQACLPRSNLVETAPTAGKLRTCFRRLCAVTVRSRRPWFGPLVGVSLHVVSFFGEYP